MPCPVSHNAFLHPGGGHRQVSVLKATADPLFPSLQSQNINTTIGASVFEQTVNQKQHTLLLCRHRYGFTSSRFLYAEHTVVN